MGSGALPGWTALVQPFYDRPDIQIPIVWYQVPRGTEMGPPSFISDNWWDDRERFWPIGVGMVYRSMKPYFGPLPLYRAGQPLIGSPSDWSIGLSYADYLKSGGSPSTPCVNVSPIAGKVKIRQGQLFSLTTVGGCRAYVPACPGEQVPCQLDWRITSHNILVDNGSATYSRSTRSWSGTGSSTTVTLRIVATGFAVTAVPYPGAFSVASIRCSPLVVTATDPQPLPFGSVLTFVYPGM